MDFYGASGRPGGNLIINGNCLINDLGQSGTVTLAAGAMGPNRWRAGANGCTFNLSKSGRDVVVTITAGTLIQTIAGYKISGKALWWTWLGSAPARIFQGSSASGSFAAGPLYTSGLTPNTSTAIEMSIGSFTQVQAEEPLGIGGGYTAFEQRDPGLERLLCQQYYEICTGSIRCNAASDGTLGASVQFKVSKVRVPDFVSFADGPISANVSTAGAFQGAVSIDYQSIGLQFYPLTANSVYYNYGFTVVVNAEIT